MSCGKCKHQLWNEIGPDYCAAATKHIITPEGVNEDIKMYASQALEKFRKENDGKCPHFVQSRWWDVFFS